MTAGADFFDDDYHRLIAPFHPEAETRREVAALREMLAIAQDDHILDLGCGWGRHLEVLREAGHRVVGLDLSHALLRRAFDASGSGPGDAPGTRPTLVAADMRRLPFPDRSFDVVLNLATSLGLFMEDENALAALGEAARVLRPGGRILVEGMHRDDVVASFAARDRWTLPDGTEVRARRRFDPLRGVSHEVLRWTGPAGAGVKRHSLRLRNATELAALVAAAGLTLRAAYGGWEEESLVLDSDRLILVAER
jgi:SAM-dependent methyltransferase